MPGKKQQTGNSDLGNPANAKIVTEIANKVAKDQGKERPDDSDEFYEEFNRRTDPRKKAK